VESTVLLAARRAARSASTQPLYLRLAEALASCVEADGSETLPSARATVTAAYRELARRGLVVMRPGRPRRSPWRREADVSSFAAMPAGVADLARYAPDEELLPTARVFRWLGLGQGEGERVAQYGHAWGYAPLRKWVAARLQGVGVRTSSERVLLTAGVQHGLDLLLRSLLHAGEAVLVEDPTYPGLPPLLALHRLATVGLPFHHRGIDLDKAAALLRRTRVRAAILTPTLHNPSGLVLDEGQRRMLLALLGRAGALIIEEFFDPSLVCDGNVPPPLAALDPGVISVGSFSKVLFPGLRVGWIAGPAAFVERAAAVKTAADLSGSPFLEAAAWTLCQRGVLDEQLARLRRAAQARGRIVFTAFQAAPAGVEWSRPRGGFSLLVTLPDGWSSRAVATRAAERGVWILPGSAMSVSGRDDVLRVAYAACGGAALQTGMEQVLAALSPVRGTLPLV
jgi:2-aminoadipate transaminase